MVFQALRIDPAPDRRRGPAGDLLPRHRRHRWRSVKSGPGSGRPKPGCVQAETDVRNVTFATRLTRHLFQVNADRRCRLVSSMAWL
jgi:hypothetical protein